MPRAIFYAYTYLYPDGSHVRLVSRTTLDFLKALRAQGVEVVVLPDDGTPIHYLVRKGEPSLFTDPVFAYLVGIPTSVIASLFAAWLHERRWRDRQPEEESEIVLRIEEGGTSLFYSETGAQVSEAHAERVIHLLESVAENLNTVSKARAKDPQHRFPICLEHTDEIIGWTHVQEDERGLRMKDGEFVDSTLWARVDSGELRGASIGGIATESECSICGADYSECNHISGLEYDGSLCINAIRKFELAEVSLVREPVNQGCLIDLGLRGRAS